MAAAIDLSTLYSLRNQFTIIGLTGRTGSGVSDVADLLQLGFEGADKLLPKPKPGANHNSWRKYRIIYRYAKENFDPFVLIQYRHVLTLFILKYGLDALVDFLQSPILKKKFQKAKLKITVEFSDEILKLRGLQKSFDGLQESFNKASSLEKKLEDKNALISLYEFYQSDEFQIFSQKVHEILSSKSKVKRNKTLQVIANNIRKTGTPYDSGATCPDCIFTIVSVINNLIKGYRKKLQQSSDSGETSTQVVIDSLRNPLEIMFFRQRYSAFYIMAVTRQDEEREAIVTSRYEKEIGDAQNLFREEYNGGEDHEFYKQKVKDCIQLADVHISFLSQVDAEKKNENLSENTSPYFSWPMQLIKYISLMSHPGLVTPSPEERCMQIAYTAKYNSGCISRQVGAAITDENYSIRAIGWNNTPEGQVPCVLRSADDILENMESLLSKKQPIAEFEKDKGAQYDLKAFTPFEKTDTAFLNALQTNFQDAVNQNSDKVKGRNICFCFKSLKNSYDEGKNQVHTRSLHAEESAFLQITKYGGVGIKGGKLFTTASPCELCSKKAVQLGIKVIYYIDPYPGISQKQILEAGARPPEVRLFNGAIGNAYHWLYEPIMAYKDELGLILGQEIKDLTSDLKNEVNEKNARIKELEEKLAAAEAK